MHWFDDAHAIAPALPAIWLVRTDAQPSNLTERSALRRGLARRVLARQLGCGEGHVVIAHDAAGRPLLDLPRETGLHLSLATRAGIVAVGLARHPLGADVEQVDERAAPPRDLLHPDERNALEAIASTEQARSFARLWAAKEAYVKALGMGFRRAPESFAVSLLSETTFRVTDASAPTDTVGALCTMKNGGHEIMAAAFVVTG
ncbi:4'-phosphopantetheinyl transferase family protein [Bosea beijingensis]|uniref:4'-phosphopantetheinyl transferase family protein n=1 Tax=Bosea beijingensis TaxID=3068632 RepID=UPI0027413FDE|nr:4'-phosphopantetheinyl transferase superfamily protein [Bosea sp. REN20]